MGQVRHSSQHPKRLKPSLQQLLYHAKQPILTVLAGSVIALAINFSLAQVHLSQYGDNSAASNPIVLDSFDIKTDPGNKEVNIILHRQSDKSAAPKLQVHTAQRGNQYTLTLENTQLSQQMVDNGLPVVIDNQNKLIGRAVPGKTVNQAKIIIPNLPSQNDYQVLVYEQVANQQPRLLSGGNGQTIASQQQTTTVAQASKPSVNNAYEIPALNKQPEAAIRKPIPQPQKAPQAIHIAEIAKPRAEKVATVTRKPTPRSAVPSIESRFDSIAESATLRSAPLASLPQSQENFALASIAKNPSANSVKVKRPIQITENRLASDNEIAIRPKNLAPLSSAITTDTTLSASPRAVNNGSITYVPAFSSKSSKSGFQHGPLWNPYVVKEQPEEQAKPSNPVSNETVSLSQIPPLQNSTPSPDPLWYLHNLSNSGAPNNSNVALQALPDLNNGAPANSNPTLSPGTTATPALASGSILIDNQFIKTLKQTLLNLPIWFYIVFGLFFGGIGLFATFGAVFILQQVWLNAKRPTVIQVASETKAEAKPIEAAPQQPEPTFNTEAIQFNDSTNIELRHYLEQNRAWDQQQHIKNAVKKSVLLHFPSQRAGSKNRTNTRKASSLLL